MSFTIQIIQDTTQTVVKEFTISDGQFLALKADLPGETGALQWFEDAIKGKIQRCVKRLRKNWTTLLVNEETLPPKADDDFVTLIASRPDYNDRETRELKGK